MVSLPACNSENAECVCFRLRAATVHIPLSSQMCRYYRFVFVEIIPDKDVIIVYSVDCCRALFPGISRIHLLAICAETDVSKSFKYHMP